MTKDEALREAIDTLKSTKHGNCDFAWIDETLKKCTEALAQPPLPVQEPLEYWNAVEGWVKIDEMRKHFDSVNCGTIYRHGGEGRVPLYTTPPQRQWVGLTEEDRCKFAAAQYGWEDLCLAVEAKLKEKNHG